MSDSRLEGGSFESVEKEPNIFLIHVPELSKEQIQHLGKIFDNLNKADNVDIDDRYYGGDKEYEDEINAKLDNPERFHVAWRFGRAVYSFAPQYPSELLNLDGNYFIAGNEHTKEIILEELEGLGVTPIDVKEGGEKNLLEDLDRNVKGDIKDRLSKSKRKWLHRWPGSPRH